MLLDLHAGPLVIEVPEGPLLGAALDINQRWIRTWACPAPTPARAASICCCRRATAGEVPAATYTAEATS